MSVFFDILGKCILVLCCCVCFLFTKFILACYNILIPQQFFLFYFYNSNADFI